MQAPVIRYKLTDDIGYTYNKTEWGPGKVYTTSGHGELCGSGWLHCYSDPILAMFMNPSHAAFKSPRLCEVECSGQYKDDRGRKEGWTTMAFKRWLDVPEITTTQRVAFAILCAKQVYSEPKWLIWANNWLNGTDRSRAAAVAVYAAAAYDAAAAVAVYAAAAYDAAANAASAAAAAYAASAAADAAVYAADAKIDLASLAHQATEYK